MYKRQALGRFNGESESVAAGADLVRLTRQGQRNSRSKLWMRLETIFHVMVDEMLCIHEDIMTTHDIPTDTT